MADVNAKGVLTAPIFKNNPIALQILDFRLAGPLPIGPIRTGSRLAIRGIVGIDLSRRCEQLVVDIGGVEP